MRSAVEGPAPRETQSGCRRPNFPEPRKADGRSGKPCSRTEGGCIPRSEGRRRRRTGSPERLRMERRSGREAGPAEERSRPAQPDVQAVRGGGRLTGRERHGLSGGRRTERAQGICFHGAQRNGNRFPE